MPRREAKTGQHLFDSLRDWLRDPLFAFLLIGVAVFAASAWLRGGDDRLIVIHQAQVDRLATLWETQTGRPPSDRELTALIDDHVREEVMVREATRLGLDQEDAIIRRRLAQKLTFLTEDVATLEPPTEEELRGYFVANKERYATPAVVTFSHIYFSPDRRADAAADAKAALADLDPEAWRKTGDPFMLGRTYTHAGLKRVERDFGADFIAGLAKLSTGGDWQGPIQSAYGLHLLRLDAKSPPLGADYESVATRVAADFDADRRSVANKAHFDDLKAQYSVRLP